MPHIPSPLRRTNPAAALGVLGALYVLAGGWIHLREWSETYRHVPAEIAGSAVVRIGFVANAAMSVVLAVAVVVALLKLRRALPLVLAATIGFQLASLVMVVASRRGDAYGWMEPEWTSAATQSALVEAGAVVTLAAVAVLLVLQRGTPWSLTPRPGWTSTGADPVPAQASR